IEDLACLEEGDRAHRRPMVPDTTGRTMQREQVSSAIGRPRARGLRPGELRFVIQREEFFLVERLGIETTLGGEGEGALRTIGEPGRRASQRRLGVEPEL